VIIVYYFPDHAVPGVGADR